LQLQQKQKQVADSPQGKSAPVFTSDTPNAAPERSGMQIRPYHQKPYAEPFVGHCKKLFNTFLKIISGIRLDRSIYLRSAHPPVFCGVDEMMNNRISTSTN
jgi:hypothetical protein